MRYEDLRVGMEVECDSSRFNDFFNGKATVVCLDPISVIRDDCLAGSGIIYKHKDGRAQSSWLLHKSDLKYIKVVRYNEWKGKARNVSRVVT